MPNKLTKKEMDAYLADIRKNRENNIYYTAPLGYFAEQSRIRRNNQLNVLIKILEKKGKISRYDAQTLLAMD